MKWNKLLLMTSLALALVFQAGLLAAGDIRGWQGTVRYALDHKEDIYRHDISFMKLKGLLGQDFRKIIFEGTITFIPTNRPNFFVAQGKVNYDVSMISVAKMGEAMIVHTTGGKGMEKVEPIHQINFLEISPQDGTYFISVSPGVEDEELGAFGVPVQAVSYMKVTRAFLDKMESENRKVPFPESLKKMFPDVKTDHDRESIRGEAFGRPFPGTETIKDSVTDEYGGKFSWHLKRVVLKNTSVLNIGDEEGLENQ